MAGWQLTPCAAAGMRLQPPVLCARPCSGSGPVLWLQLWWRADHACLPFVVQSVWSCSWPPHAQAKRECTARWLCCPQAGHDLAGLACMRCHLTAVHRGAWRPMMQLPASFLARERVHTRTAQAMVAASSRGQEEGREGAAEVCGVVFKTFFQRVGNG